MVGCTTAGSLFLSDLAEGAVTEITACAHAVVRGVEFACGVKREQTPRFLEVIIIRHLPYLGGILVTRHKYPTTFSDQVRVKCTSVLHEFDIIL